MGFFASLGKKRVSEAEAAGAFVLANVKRAEEVWPKVAKGVNATFGTSLPFDRNAVCQFALAILLLRWRLSHASSLPIRPRVFENTSTRVFQAPTQGQVRARVCRSTIPSGCRLAKREKTQWTCLPGHYSTDLG